MKKFLDALEGKIDSNEISGVTRATTQVAKHHLKNPDIKLPQGVDGSKFAEMFKGGDISKCPFLNGSMGGNRGG